MSLSGKQLDYLRGLAHSLKPIVAIGQSGLSAAVIAETDLALAHHELIKVRLPAIDRQQRHALLENLAESTESIVVQRVGRNGTLYKAGESGRIKLPPPKAVS